VAKTLVKNVYVGKVWYGPAHGNAENVPAEVAARITNPRAWEGKGEDESPTGEAATTQTAGGSPSRPARNDPKHAWVDYAVSQGADRAEAEGSSKADLVDAYGE
jgi:hypothetical protein